LANNKGWRINITINMFQGQENMTHWVWLVNNVINRLLEVGLHQSKSKYI